MTMLPFLYPRKKQSFLFINQNDIFVSVKFLQRIALYTSLLFVLGHTLTPHAHAEEVSHALCVHEENNARSFMDVIACFFHPDLGSDHLEEFVGSEDFNFDFFISRQADFNYYIPSAIRFSSEAQSIFTGLRAAPPTLRGPPVKA